MNNDKLMNTLFLTIIILFAIVIIIAAYYIYLMCLEIESYETIRHSIMPVGAFFGMRNP